MSCHNSPPSSVALCPMPYNMKKQRPDTTITTADQDKLPHQSISNSIIFAPSKSLHCFFSLSNKATAEALSLFELRLLINPPE
eukprot:scaffold5398_cov70-Skeletonema_marinoi.AAC.11